MTAALTWDNLEDRLFDAGVDRGVLYLSDRTGVPWNGLTSVEENLSDETSDEVYFDGVKRTTTQKLGDYSGTLNAYTYPIEFLEYEGSVEVGNGLYSDSQDPKFFGLSYRTMVGNAIDGVDFGYKIHLVYNVLATPTEQVHSSLTEDPDLIEFAWDLSAIPLRIPNFRPTAHFIFDTTLLDPEDVSAFEDFIYGDDTHPPRLPTWDELVAIFIPPPLDIITEPITEPM